MELKLDLPEDLFDSEFTQDAFATRVRELAIFELVRLKRLHEHEAQRMLALERWELVERMEAVGIVPTEKAFEQIRSDLEGVIKAARRKRSGVTKLKK